MTVELLSPSLVEPPFHQDPYKKMPRHTKSGILKMFKDRGSAFIRLKTKKPDVLLASQPNDTNTIKKQRSSTHRSITKFLGSIRKPRTSHNQDTHELFHEAKKSASTPNTNITMTLSKEDVEAFVHQSCMNNVEDMYKEYGETVKEIGRGAGGTVYLLKRQTDSKLFAVKIHELPGRHDANYTEFREKLMQEIFLSLSLNHLDFVGRTHAVFFDCKKNQYYQVMDYYRFDLFAYISYVGEDSGLSRSKATKVLNDIFVNVVKSVNVLHQIGVAHRDLKPENICVDQNGNIKIIDFGCAKCGFITPSSPKRRRGRTYSMYNINKSLLSNKSTSGLCCPLLSTNSAFFSHQAKAIYANDVSGTSSYIPPEEYMGGVSYDALKADAWALGIIFVALHTARFPWTRAAALLDANYTRYLRERTLAPMFKKYCKTDFFLDSKSELALIRLLEPNPYNRISLAELVSSPWFETLNH